ncbi:variant leucine-rich repeat-containing protein [Nostoc sp.]|uniref:variant leucine-rich repeat-containing protein n=1 Tax=Nostoc sp. TaxID=1180 RepID=UPI002FF494E1
MSLDSLKQEATNHHTSPQRLRELAAINDELRRLVAANPLADSSLLGELAIQARTNKDVEMQRAIASNPNTPTQWLIGLAYLFPEEFFSNPAYDLSILQNVNFNLLLKLVCASNVPTSFLEFAAGICETNIKRIRNKLVRLPEISTNFLNAASQLETFPEILNIIANDPKTPKEVLDKLAKNSLNFIAEAAKLHINYAGELETGWRDLAEEKIDRTQLPTLNNDEEGIELRLWYAGAIDESTLPYLNQKSVHEYTSTLLKIICSADTPRPILDNLETHPRLSQLIAECVTYLKQREAIVFDLLPGILPINSTKLSNNFAANQINPIVPDLNTLFTKLEDRKWWFKIRYIRIDNPTINLCLLDLMQTSRGSRRRRSYLQNMLMDFDRGRYKDHNLMFIKFFNLEYYGVILANEPRTSPEILAKLVEHPIQGVRVLVASHHNITQNSLDNLIDDRNPEVRAAALANPKLDSMLREQLATLENPNLSSLDLRELANSEHTAVKTKVTRHPNVDASILAKLAHDKLMVKLAVAKHPKTPGEILTRFTEHQDRRLPLAVAQNPGAPQDLLIQLATQPAVRGGFYFNPLNLAAVKSLLTQEPEAAIPFLDRCLKFPDRPSFSRFLVLMNPHIPSSFLGRYYKSWFWPERYAIAQNPNTERDICQQLTQDANSIVRAAARDTLK